MGGGGGGGGGTAASGMRQVAARTGNEWYRAAISGNGFMRRLTDLSGNQQV